MHVACLAQKCKSEMHGKVIAARNGKIGSDSKQKVARFTILPPDFQDQQADPEMVGCGLHKNTTGINFPFR